MLYKITYYIKIIIFLSHIQTLLAGTTELQKLKWEHIFSSLKIPVFRETNEQQHKLNIHYIRNKPQAFWVIIQWTCVLKWKRPASGIWATEALWYPHLGLYLSLKGRPSVEVEFYTTVCTKDRIAWFNHCTKTLHRIWGWKS